MAFSPFADFIIPYELAYSIITRRQRVNVCNAISANPNGVFTEWALDHAPKTWTLAQSFTDEYKAVSHNECP